MSDNKRQDPKPKQVSHEGGTSGLIEVQVLPLSKLVGNTGQIEGLPKNPRLLKDDRFRKLVKSIEDDPEMLDLRELIVVPKDGIYVVIAGNMRLRAMQELKMKEAQCKVLPADTAIEKLKAYTIKDNVPFGEHDWSALANEWDADELSDWGLDLPIAAVEGDPFDDDGISASDQYGVIVMCKDDTEQARVFEKLVADGHTCKVVVT